MVGSDLVPLLIQWSTLVPLLFHECIRDYEPNKLRKLFIADCTTHLTESARRGVKDICHIMSRLGWASIHSKMIARSIPV